MAATLAPKRRLTATPKLRKQLARQPYCSDRGAQTTDNIAAVPPTVIRIHALAPAKPPLAAPCNGCGVCCLSEPCPLGILVTRRRRGRCAALRWEPASSRYRCGLATASGEHPRAVLRGLRRGLARLARRWIAAGTGCDSRVEIEAGR